MLQLLQRGEGIVFSHVCLSTRWGSCIGCWPQIWSPPLYRAPSLPLHSSPALLDIVQNGTQLQTCKTWTSLYRPHPIPLCILYIYPQAGGCHSTEMPSCCVTFLSTFADTFTIELIAWRKFTPCPVMDTFLLFLTMYLSRQFFTTDTSHFCKFVRIVRLYIRITCTKDPNTWTNSRTIQLRGHS